MRLIVAAVGRLKRGPERDLSERYRDRAFLPPSYGKRITQLIAHFRQKYGMTTDPRGRMANKWPAQALGGQLDLF